MLSQRIVEKAGKWRLAHYSPGFSGYFWVPTSIAKDGYTYYMEMTSLDGFCIITEETSKDTEQIFKGYIETEEDLKNVERLLKLAD